MPEQTGNMVGPRQDVRLSDLRVWHVVTATCISCRHAVRIPVERLTKGRPMTLRLMDLEPRLLCCRCGNREGNRLVATAAPRE